jgi:apolipoprotein D and lipocalin family protein
MTMRSAVLLSLSLILMSACTSTRQPPLRGLERPVDLPKFMGDWYVLGYIPIHLPPLFSERDAYNGIESYRLDPDGTIATTYTFRRGSFSGPDEKFTPRARVTNPPVNSEWKMKFFWYLPAGDFLILHVDEQYQATVIGVPDRSHVWIMARSPALPAAEYQELLNLVEGMGYDMSKIVVVPQQANGAPAPR